MQKIKDTLSFSIVFLVLVLFSLPSSARDLSKLKGSINDEVIRLLRALPPDESYPDATVIVVLDERVDEVHDDRSRRTTLHTVFKVLNEGGKGYANVEIGFNSRSETIHIEHARTITPDGEILPLIDDAVRVVTPYGDYASYSDYRILTFSLPGVAVGSIIDYKVVVEERHPAVEGEYASRFYFQGYEPTFLSRFKIIAPEDMHLRYHVRNPPNETTPSPVVYYYGRRKTFLWEYRDVHQIMPERTMPPISDITFNVWVTTIGSWNGFCSWWNKLKAGKTKPDDAIREIVAKLTRGLKTPEEKAAAIFDYVEREIRYVSMDLGKSGYEPARASEVFANKYGDGKDKSSLLISMLGEAGIPAYYVLICTREAGRFFKDFPFPFQFNHCMVAVGGEHAYHFLDPAAETHPFNYLPSQDQGRQALIIDGQKGTFTRTSLAKPRENGLLHRQTITITPDGSIEVEQRSVSFGDVGASHRAIFRDCGPSELRETFERTLSAVHPEAKLIDYSISDPLDFERPFVRTYRYTVMDYCKKSGDLVIFQLPGVSYGCPFPLTKSRRYPLKLPSVYSLRNEVVVNIPDGYTVHYLPKPVDISTPDFSFHSSYRHEGDQIFYEGEQLGKTTTIALDDYPLYRRFCQERERGTGQWVILKK